ncbi:hypothetical protein BS17DRAFT_471032 [Gyrodon lividus]|nr:hypothetical protein BS17DRAFT_471032 [Gyrodon lividus]
MIKLFAFILPISTLCQSVITLRVWYLFSRSPIVRSFAVAILAITTVVNALIVAMLWKDIRNWVFDPFTPSTIVWVYVPSLFIHTTLFMLKVYRFVTSSVRTQTDTLLWRFVKEGMFMYAFAMASLLFGIIGLSMTDASDISTRTIAAEGSPIVASIAVAVARVMLSIRSVAATAHVDPEWLLNHAELSRVQWRRGAVDGEIIVEAGAISPPVRSLTLGAHESFMLSEYGTQELESNENI